MNFLVLVLFEIAEPVLNPHTKSQNILKAIHPSASQRNCWRHLPGAMWGGSKNRGSFTTCATSAWFPFKKVPSLWLVRSEKQTEGGVLSWELNKNNTDALLTSVQEQLKLWLTWLCFSQATFEGQSQKGRLVFGSWF